MLREVKEIKVESLQKQMEKTEDYIEKKKIKQPNKRNTKSQNYKRIRAYIQSSCQTIKRTRYSDNIRRGR